MDTFNPNQMPPLQTESNTKSVAPLVAVVIILAVIIIGGLYFFQTRSSNKNMYAPTAEVPAGDNITNSLKQQGTSDDLNSIESDLKLTNVDNIDQGAAAVEAKLQ